MQLFPLEGPIDLTESKNISTLNLSNPSILKRGQTYQFHRMFMGAEQFRLKRSNVQTIAGRSFTLLQGKFEKELSKVIHYLQYNFYTPEEAKRLSKKIFYENYRQAYFLGLKAAGTGISQSYSQLLFKDSSSPEIQEIEERWVKTAAAAEMKFWNKFVKDVVNNRSFKVSMANRIKMYALSLEGTYNAGRVAGSPLNSIVYWNMDKKIHMPCPECEHLAATSPWPKDLLPTTPKAGLCSCLFNCLCSLKIVPTTAEEYKKFRIGKPAIQQTVRKIQRLRK